MKGSAAVAVAGLVMCMAGVARADVWDVQTANDNTPASTLNELVHGAEQVHDLAALPGPTQDFDWFRISQQPYSSYEVIVDGNSGDTVFITLNRTDVTGGSTLQSSVPVALGMARRLSFSNPTASAVEERIVVTSNCGSICGADDQYRLRFFDTTYAIPRFNNSGTQTTVLIIQNPTTYTIAGTVWFWTSAGAVIASHNFNLPAHQLMLLPTANVAAGLSGSMTVTHNGRYGDLVGKAVALEPATGFSFDTPMVPRIR